MLPRRYTYSVPLELQSFISPLHVPTSAALLQSFIPLYSTYARLQRASRVAFLSRLPPYLHIARSIARLETSRPLYFRVYTRAACLQHSIPPSLHVTTPAARSILPLRDDCSEPLALQTSMLPRLHTCSEPPALHTSITSALHACGTAPEL